MIHSTITFVFSFFPCLIFFSFTFCFSWFYFFFSKNTLKQSQDQVRRCGAFVVFLCLSLTHVPIFIYFGICAVLCWPAMCFLRKKKFFFSFFCLALGNQLVMIGKGKKSKPIYKKEFYLYNSEWMLKEFLSKYILQSA